MAGPIDSERFAQECQARGEFNIHDEAQRLAWLSELHAQEEERQKRRYFQMVSEWRDSFDLLPVRGTPHSAAYDLFVVKDIVVGRERTLVPLGFKVHMPSDEYFQISLRSGNKHPIMMMNMIGIVDADYYDNPDNEGHVMLPLLYVGQTNCNGVVLERGTRIAQGIFLRYGTLHPDCDRVLTARRISGYGSTGQ